MLFITSIRNTKSFGIVTIEGNICSRINFNIVLFGARAITAQLYPGRDLFEVDQ